MMYKSTLMLFNTYLYTHRVQLAVDMPQHISNWDRESDSSGDEQLTDEAKRKAIRYICNYYGP